MATHEVHLGQGISWQMMWENPIDPLQPRCPINGSTEREEWLPFGRLPGLWAVCLGPQHQ